MMKRAYATLEIKSFDEGARTFAGIASTPTPDRMGDIVEPKGAKFTLPLPFLYQHDSHEPIGHITSATVKADGIHIRGNVANLEGPPTLKERLDVAWAEMKAGLVRGLSIGFREIESVPIDPKAPYGGVRFTSWDWLELSAVTIPANAEASITSIKSIDQAQQRAALGTAREVTTTAGATAPKPKGKSMTITEQIASFEAKRAASAARMDALMAKSAEDVTTLNEEESTEYDALMQEVGEVDKHITRLKAHEKTMVAKAVAITPEAVSSPEAASQARQGVRIEMGKSNLPKGIGLARYARALCWSKINMSSPLEFSKQWDDSTPEVSLAFKAAISAGTTTDSAWAGPLVYANNLASEFVDYLRPLTILGKMAGFRRVPFNVRYPIQNGTSTVAWVGQGAPKPVSKLSFTSATLGFAKCAGIVVITQELVKFSSPAADLVVRDDLASQMVYFLDQQFIDPGVAAVANVSPASILNGASNIRTAAAAWTTMAAVLTDVYAFMTTFAANEISLEGSYWVMTPDTALRLSLLLNTGGTDFAFPDITINGGTFLGIPVIVSNSLPHSVSAGAIIALIKPSEVFLADDGGVNISVSGEASLQMDSAPTINSATPTATSVVSMFQTDSIAIRAERFINWGLRRSYGVGYIDNMHTT